MTPPVFPAGRYGRRRERAPVRRWVTPILVVLAGVVLIGLALVAYRLQNSDAPASVTQFRIGARAVRITFVVRRPAGRPVRCLLRARDVRGAEVGRAEVPVPEGRGDLTMTFTLPTRALANTGEVYGCATR